MGTARNDRHLCEYFIYSADGVEPIDTLEEMPFGEYLVARGAVTRAQLLAALCEQDRHPGIPLGEVIAWLGYVSYPEVDRLLTEWCQIPVVEVV